MDFRYPLVGPEYLPSRATICDYLKFFNQESISAFTAAHLTFQMIPVIDSQFAFTQIYMEDTRSVHELLCTAAEEGIIENTIFIKGQFRAPLSNWFQYLVALLHNRPHSLEHIIVG